VAALAAALGRFLWWLLAPWFRRKKEVEFFPAGAAIGLSGEQAALAAIRAVSKRAYQQARKAYRLDELAYS
jgi:hypothetical protein